MTALRATQPWAYVAAAGILAVLVVYLLVQARPGARRRGALLLAGTLLLWLGGEVLVAFSPDADWARWAIRGTYAAIACIPAAIHHLVCILDPEARRHRRSGWSIAVFVLATLVLMPTDLVIAGAERGVVGFHRVDGPLFPVFASLLFTALLTDVGLAVHAARHAVGALQRVRSQYFLAGLAAAVTLGLIDLAVLQPLGIRAHRMFMAPLEATVGMGALIYSMARYRLLDIPTVLGRTAIHIGLVVTLLVPCLGLSFLSERYFMGHVALGPTLVTAALLCVAGFAFPRLRGNAEQTLQQVIFGARADHHQLLRAASCEVSSVLSLAPLAASTRLWFGRVFGGADATLWLRQGVSVVPVDRTDEDVAPLDVTALEVLESGPGPVVVSELDARDAAARLATELIGRGIELALVLRVKGRTVGLLTLGPRGDNRVYVDEDVGLVVTLGNQVATALENARLYEELRESQEQVHRATRLSAVGTLAAGIAHEIRNPLVAVRTFLQLFPKRLDDREFLLSFGRLGLAEAERIEHLITELLTFSRSHERRLRDVDLRNVVEQVVRLVGPHATKRSVAVSAVTSSRLPGVLGDADQLTQALLNVVLNAIEASPSGQAVRLQAYPVRSASGEVQVSVEVIDHGPGIPPEHLDAIFTPFFTTKDVGTGLGLAVAHQLILEHGGSLTAASSPGGGATFTVTLPASIGAGRNWAA
jgi:signal transduction histidine kinase